MRSVTVDVLWASAKPVAMPSTKRISIDGMSTTSATIGPSFSIATEKRSSVSRDPVRSSELTSTRNRIQTNARKSRIIRSQPIEVGGGTLAADQLDEHFLERPGAVLAGAYFVHRPLRDNLAVGDD